MRYIRLHRIGRCGAKVSHIAYRDGCLGTARHNPFLRKFFSNHAAITIGVCGILLEHSAATISNNLRDILCPHFVLEAEADYFLSVYGYPHWCTLNRKP